MHHALQIHEILLGIFAHCCESNGQRTTSDLPALARTCLTFKELALDILWAELVDPSPLAQCLPGTYRLQIPEGRKRPTEYYSFIRPLTPIEWGILRNYTRRIRSIISFDYHRIGLDWESVRTFLDPPTTEPLFPNLRRLYAGQSTEMKNLLYMPFPSLISLHVEFSDTQTLRALQDSLKLFPKFSPHIRRLSTCFRWPDTTSVNVLSDYIRQWGDLRNVDCSAIALDVEALVHLSHMPRLRQLSFTLNATSADHITPSNFPLLFPHLRELTLYSEFLEPIPRFLSRARLPAITDLIVLIDDRPSKQDFLLLMASIQTSVVGHTIHTLQFNQRLSTSDARTQEDPRPVLDLEDLEPYIALNDLRRITLDIEFTVDLTDGKLLALASWWPQLEHLVINADWGWNTPGGITPDGLVHLLQTCRSLNTIALAIDSRGYTEFRQLPAILDLALPPKLYIDVVDSVIAAESVPATTAFFASFVPCSIVFFHSWAICGTVTSTGMGRWRDVLKQAKFAGRPHAGLPSEGCPSALGATLFPSLVQERLAHDDASLAAKLDDLVWEYN